VGKSLKEQVFLPSDENSLHGQKLSGKKQVSQIKFTLSRTGNKRVDFKRADRLVQFSPTDVGR